MDSDEKSYFIFATALEMESVLRRNVSCLLETKEGREFVIVFPEITFLSGRPKADRHKRGPSTGETPVTSAGEKYQTQTNKRTQLLRTRPRR